MKQSDYPSLELCKRLTEAEFPETERHYWVKENGEHNIFTLPYYNPLQLKVIAPSIAELLDELPKYIDRSDLIIMTMDRTKETSWYSVFYRDEYGRVNYTTQTGRTLPNALAEMWLWLKENDLLPKK